MTIKRGITVALFCLGILASVSLLASAQTKCLRMIPGKIGTWDVYNSCPNKRKAVLNWCDGSIRKFCIAANSAGSGPSCDGTITLVAEEDC